MPRHEDSVVSDYFIDIKLVEGRLKYLRKKHGRLLSGPAPVGAQKLTGMPRGSGQTTAETDYLEFMRVNMEIKEIEQQLQDHIDLLNHCNVGRKDTIRSEILDLYYDKGLTINKIAMRINYSRETVLNEKKTAVEMFTKILTGQGFFKFKEEAE